MRAYDFMNIDMSSVEELRTRKDNTEATLRIIDVTRNTERCYVQVDLEVIGKEMTRDIRHWLSLPKPDDFPKKIERKLYCFRQFCKAFGIPIDPDEEIDIAVEEMVGAIGTVIVSREHSPRYGWQNRIKRLVNPEDEYIL